MGVVLGLASTALAAPSAAGADTMMQIVGTGTVGYSGDGGAATNAHINHPRGLALTPEGGFLVADAFGNVVRRVDSYGTIRTVAGTGVQGFGGDGGPATEARLSFPHAVALMPDGRFLVDDELNRRIRRVYPNGTIDTVAGSVQGFGGDGGPATSAKLNDSRGMDAFADGSYLIADTNNGRVRYVDTSGVISTVAGTGTFDSSVAATMAECQGSPGPSTASQLLPFGVTALPGPSKPFLVTDVTAGCVRKVSSVAGGTIETVAGNGVSGYGGDGGPAAAAQLNMPHNAAALPDGGVLIADTGNNRVRRVSSDGSISTVAGTGTAGANGIGGAPQATQLNAPKAVAPFAGGFLIADSGNARVLLAGPTAWPFQAPLPPPTAPGSGPPPPLPSLPPAAAFTLKPSSASIGARVSFDGSASRDPDGTIASYAWFFGDGSSGNGVKPSHRYAKAGTYTVTLTVTDDSGLIETVSRGITVSAAASRLRLASVQAGLAVRGGVEIGLSGSAFEADLFASTSQRGRLIRVGKTVKRKSRAGALKFSVALTRRGRKALRAARRLQLTARIRITPPGGTPTVLNRSVTLLERKR